MPWNHNAKSNGEMCGYTESQIDEFTDALQPILKTYYLKQDNGNPGRLSIPLSLIQQAFPDEEKRMFASYLFGQFVVEVANGMQFKI